MRKFVILLGLALFTNFAAEARRLTPSESLDRAFAKMQSGTRMRKCRAAKSKTNEMQLRTTLSDSKQIPLVYVYDLPQGGFMLTSGDTRAHALLGYAEGADFDAMQQNPAFMSWLQQCREALAWLAQQPETVAVEHSETQLTSSVEPLLGDIAWNQDAPFNDLCPLRENENGEIVHAPTGCVTTAMTQVMCYHQWPQRGTGQHTNKNESTQVVDFTQSTYDWSLIKHQYSPKEKGAAAEAVARLMYDAGCALDMDYDGDGSGTPTTMAVHALTEHFGYNKSMTLEYRDFYTTEAWNELLRSELDARRPIIFGADTSHGNGHEFVIDGYDTNGLYHVNWGWSNLSNDYFDINYLFPAEQGIGGGTGGYNVQQQALIGVQKDEDGSSVAVTNLIIESYLEYNPESGEIAFSFCNNGGIPFIGFVGYALCDEKGNIISVDGKGYAEESLGVNCSDTLLFDTNDLGPFKPGYTLRPIYADSEDSPLQPIRTPISAPSYLQYEEEDGVGYWGTPSDMALPMLRLIDCKVVSNLCGFAPSFELTIENDKDGGQEYNKTIQIDVHMGEEIVCTGTEQLFLQPGESKTFTIKCDLGEYEQMPAGQYAFIVFFKCAQSDEQMTDFVPFEMEELNVTYSNFALNKTTFAPGEAITMTFDALNQGSTHEGRFYLGLLHEGEYSPFDGIKLEGVELTSGVTVPISITYNEPLEPGNYSVGMYDFVSATWISSIMPIEVQSAETAVDKVVADTEHTGKVYDLTGRLVRGEGKRGFYIRNGRKHVSTK